MLYACDHSYTSTGGVSATEQTDDGGGREEEAGRAGGVSGEGSAGGQGAAGSGAGGTDVSVSGIVSFPDPPSWE